MITQGKRFERRTVNVSPEALIPPNREYVALSLSKITATYKSSSCNKTLTMENNGNGTFTLIEGDTGIRWNSKAKRRVIDISFWDQFFQRYIKEGYILYDDRKREKVTTEKIMNLNGKDYASLKDKYAADLVEKLTSMANQFIEESYQKSITDVPDSAFEEAKKTLDELALGYKQMTNDSFNEHLTHLFAVLPRRIDRMSKYIADRDATEEDRAKIIETERDRYDVLHTMLRGGNMSIMNGKETILDVYGLEIRKFTKEEENMVKAKLRSNSSRYKNGWRVINKRTEKLFNEFCEKEGLSVKAGIDLLFHGSRSENWWSIVTNGLNINPVGVVITGKAYGNGTYFAPDAQKSLGYTSARGSKWANGSADVGYMGLYQVATGNRYNGSRGCDSSLNWDKLQQIQPGAHCTWAERTYSGFMMDEVIVYQNCQSTVWGVLELSM